jgi:hypothetical protein
VRQGLKCQVEVILKSGTRQFLRLRKSIPNTVQILDEGSLEVRDGGSAKMVTNNEEKEGSLGLAASRLERLNIEGEAF